MEKQEFTRNMVLGFRRVGGASCRLQKPLALPKHMHEGIVEVTRVLTDDLQRGKGYATTLIHRICQEADKNGLTLFLQVDPYGDGPLDCSALEGWYSRAFGFAPIQAEPLLMARMPGSTPKVGLKLSPLASAMIQSIKETAK